MKNDIREYVIKILIVHSIIKLDNVIICIDIVKNFTLYR